MIVGEDFPPPFSVFWKGCVMIKKIVCIFCLVCAIFGAICLSGCVDIDEAMPHYGMKNQYSSN